MDAQRFMQPWLLSGISIEMISYVILKLVRRCLIIRVNMRYPSWRCRQVAWGMVLMSDGECNEGSVWESAMFAAAHKMDQLVAIVDYNGLQAVGKSDEIMGNTSLAEKFESFGWAARKIDGHNMNEILDALKDIPFMKDKPSAIIAKTVSGYGIPFMENNQLWFYRSPDRKDLERALKEIDKIKSID